MTLCHQCPWLSEGGCTAARCTCPMTATEVDFLRQRDEEQQLVEMQEIIDRAIDRVEREMLADLERALGLPVKEGKR